VNTQAAYDRRVPDLALSVVVPTRGGATRLPVLLDALAAQTVAEPWEVVFVLDGDVDGSREVIEAYADRLPSRILERAGGDGVAAALAAGYDAAHGEIVLRCDDDLTPSPRFLAGHLARHRSRPAGAPALGVISLTRDVFRDTPYATAYGRPANERLIAQAYARPPEERWRHWAACNSVPKAAYEAVGGFDPTMTYREDSELGLRLARHGVEIVIDPELEIEHRGPAPDVASRAGRAFTSGASTVAFGERHPATHQDSTRTASAWNRAVRLAAGRVGSHHDAVTFGRRMDRLLSRLPVRARGKVIAWAVESAAEAGRRVGDSTWTRDVTAPATSVSVVIPHYGDPAPTLELVRQLAAQTYPAQLVVADDASPSPFPEVDGVEVVRRRTNGGFGANVNSGAAVATGDALLVLNSDLTVEPTFIADMVSAAQTHPRSVLAPRMVDDHGVEAWVGRKFPTTRHQAAAWLTPLARFRHTSAWHRAVGHDVRARSAEREVDWVVGAAMWIPLADFEAVGGFDERFFMNSEEIDLQRRLRELGVHAVALRNPTVVHAGGGSSPSDARRRWLVEGQLLYAGKWGSPRTLRLALTAAAGVNLAFNAARRLRGQDVGPITVAQGELAMIRGRNSHEQRRGSAASPEPKRDKDTRPATSRSATFEKEQGGMTLIVVAYNHSRFLPALLASIDSQTQKPDRVILCDDVSVDDSRAVLSEWARHSGLDVETRFNASNLGLTPTLNLALAEVTTPYYAYISGDDVMEPTRVANQLAILAASDHAFVYSDATVVDEDDLVVSSSFFSEFLGRDDPEDTFDSLLTKGNWIPACSVMLRTAAVRQIGGYDEALFFEDYDMWLRLARIGTFTHTPAPEVRFRRVGTSLGSSRFDDADDGWQWAKIHIRTKHLGRDKETDRIIVDQVGPWLVTLAARGHPRNELASLMRSSFTRSPSLATLRWAAVASVPLPWVLQHVARWRRS
jgi:GT2 family glycosyltransferase